MTLLNFDHFYHNINVKLPPPQPDLSRYSVSC